MKCQFYRAYHELHHSIWITNHAAVKTPDHCGTGPTSLPDQIWWVLGRGSLPPWTGLCPAPPVTKLQEDLPGAQLWAGWGTDKHFSRYFTLGLCLEICWTLCLFLWTRARMVSVLHDGALQENLSVDSLQRSEIIPGNSLCTEFPYIRFHSVASSSSVVCFTTCFMFEIKSANDAMDWMGKESLIPPWVTENDRDKTQNTSQVKFWTFLENFDKY